MLTMRFMLPPPGNRMREYVASIEQRHCSVSILDTDLAAQGGAAMQMRLQLQRPQVVSGKSPRYTGMLNAFSTIARQEGVYSLWKVRSLASGVRHGLSKCCSAMLVT
jgi:hypothetical protein